MGLTRHRSGRSRRTPASTPRWYTTTSAPRPSCSPRRSTSRSTRCRSSVRCSEIPVEEIGHTLPSLLLPLWDSEMGKGFIATLRSILAGNDVSLVRSFLQEVIADEVGSRVDDPPGSGPIRVQFVASQLVGVVMARYILELEPFKSLPVEQIAETIAPEPAALPHRRSTRIRLTLARAAAGARRRRSRRRPRRPAAPGCRPRCGTHAAAAGCRELVADQQQRPAVLRADQDAQQLFVEHSGGSADRDRTIASGLPCGRIGLPCGTAGAGAMRRRLERPSSRPPAPGWVGLIAACACMLALVGDGRLSASTSGVWLGRLSSASMKRGRVRLRRLEALRAQRHRLVDQLGDLAAACTAVVVTVDDRAGPASAVIVGARSSPVRRVCADAARRAQRRRAPKPDMRPRWPPRR